ncbi:recombinase family protein [Zobellia sp. 1_MG-2023]|uniref:recombinase family protein n=1 Tax=Zobellia sp. 1_MG-2023 TaxID=3062626 RepID=UPI0026E3D3AC|nr:recombinase family protein [Zobellia sp. 1_MG-2023]MDO6819070.1 recombinase family protein [Zobellia sp. 1_MG-2023]
MLAIYCRISQKKAQGKDRSIKEQRLRGIELAKKLKIKYKVFIDEGVSGTWALKDRPAFFKLVSDLLNKKGKITTVYALDPSRLYRNDETRLSFLAAVKKKDIQLYFDNGLYDWSDPYMNFMGKVLSATDVLHVDVTKLKVKAVLERNAKEGKGFGITPYGYETDKRGYLTKHPEESKTVKRIYELSLSGVGTRTIAETLNKEGVPTRYNKIKKGSITTVNKDTGKLTTTEKKDVKWAGNTIRNILTNPIYKGLRIWNSKDSKSNKERLKEGVKIEPEIEVELPELALFDAFYWQRVNDNLKNNANNSGKKVEHKYMLKGLLECKECGRNYYGRTRTNKKDNYYMCSSKRYKESTCTNRSINIDLFEGFVWSIMFDGGTIYDKMVQTFNEGGSDKRKKELETLIESHNQSLLELTKEHKRMVQALIKGTLSDDDVKDEKLRITRAQNDVNERLDKDTQELYQLESETKILDDIAFDWGFLSEETKETLFEKGKEKLRADLKRHLTKQKRLKEFNPNWNEKRRIVRKYLKRIYIESDKQNRIFIIRVEYNLPIEQETYLIDWNYIAYYNATKKRSVQYYPEITRRFTHIKVMQATQLLRNYSANCIEQDTQEAAKT